MHFKPAGLHVTTDWVHASFMQKVWEKTSTVNEQCSIMLLRPTANVEPNNELNSVEPINFVDTLH